MHCPPSAHLHPPQRKIRFSYLDLPNIDRSPFVSYIDRLTLERTSCHTRESQSECREFYAAAMGNRQNAWCQRCECPWKVRGCSKTASIRSYGSQALCQTAITDYRLPERLSACASPRKAGARSRIAPTAFQAGCQRTDLAPESAVIHKSTQSNGLNGNNDPSPSSLILRRLFRFQADSGGKWE